MDDPISRIEWVPSSRLRPNEWNPNRVMTPELRLLERSILSLGWVQPVLANPDGLIIDGFHRWRLSQDSPAIKQRYNRRVPVCWMDVDTPTAMAITVRINRAKGEHTAIEMSRLAHSIVRDHGWTRERLAEEIGATATEIDLLMQDDVFTAKGISSWAYSSAWYPVPTDSPEGQAAVAAGVEVVDADAADEDLEAELR